MTDFSEERAKLDAEWEKLKQAKAEFEKELSASGLEQKLFVGNLDESTTEEELRERFGEFGEIKEIVMLKDREGKSKRSSFVKFYTKASADKAIDAIAGKVHDKGQEKFMVVRFAAPKPVANQQNQFAAGGFGNGGFGNSMGMAMGANRGMGAMGGYQNNGYGAAATSYGSAAATSYGSYGGMNAGQQVATGSYGSGRGPAGCNLYVNNLAVNAGEEDVRVMFADFGTVLSVKVFTGYGFVSFDNPSSAQNAIKCLNGLAMGGSTKRLEVSLKKEKGAPATTRYNPY